MAEATTVMDPAAEGQVDVSTRWRKFLRRADGGSLPADWRANLRRVLPAVAGITVAVHQPCVFACAVPERTTLYTSLPEAEKARVVDALKTPASTLC